MARVKSSGSESVDNLNDFKASVDIRNLDGSMVKAILISQAGSEGLDFKFIRQVHIMEPWYNMNRIEQIIGRAVRNCSHKLLPFNKRNVQIFLHGLLRHEKKKKYGNVPFMSYIYLLTIIITIYYIM